MHFCNARVGGLGEVFVQQKFWLYGMLSIVLLSAVLLTINFSVLDICCSFRCSLYTWSRSASHDSSRNNDNYSNSAVTIGRKI